MPLQSSSRSFLYTPELFFYFLLLFLFFQSHPTASFHFKKDSNVPWRNVLPPVHGSLKPPSFPKHPGSPRNSWILVTSVCLSFPFLTPQIPGKSIIVSFSQSHIQISPLEALPPCSLVWTWRPPLDLTSRSLFLLYFATFTYEYKPAQPGLCRQQPLLAFGDIPANEAWCSHWHPQTRYSQQCFWKSLRTMLFPLTDAVFKIGGVGGSGGSHSNLVGTPWCYQLPSFNLYTVRLPGPTEWFE